MASISYSDIYKAFLGNITDYKLASLDEQDANSLMQEYLHKSIFASYVRRLFDSLTLDDYNQSITYTMKYSTDEQSDEGFVIGAISKWMVYEWLQAQVKTTTLTEQMIFSSKEKSYYSQANHLSELRSLAEEAYKEARFFIMDRGYISNKYLGG